MATKPPAVALIDEELCIGCTLCIEACPFDAIVGAARFMHTVIARDCTGCRLCLPPCPVDCISMVETGTQFTREQKKAAAAQAKRRFESREHRLQQEQQERATYLAAAKDTTAEQKKRAAIHKAMARARERLQQRGR